MAVHPRGVKTTPESYRHGLCKPTCPGHGAAEKCLVGVEWAKKKFEIRIQHKFAEINLHRETFWLLAKILADGHVRDFLSLLIVVVVIVGCGEFVAIVDAGQKMTRVPVTAGYEADCPGQLFTS